MNGAVAGSSEKVPARLCSSHLDCLVRMWLAHHHEHALLAALCSILSPKSDRR